MENTEIAILSKQVRKIKEMGFEVRNEWALQSYLKDINFYRLTSYMTVISRQNNGALAPFGLVQKAYDFDNTMRTLLFDIIQETELHLRTSFAHYHTARFGDYGYLDKDSFSSNHDRTKFRARIKNCIEVNKNHPLIKGYGSRTIYPLGIIIEFFSTGMLSTFYSDLITENKKKIASEMYHATAKQMTSWLCCLTDIRNKCAHYSRLYGWNFSAMPVIPKEYKYVPNRKLFTQVLVLSILYPERDKWNNVVLPKLGNIISQYKEFIYMRGIGFPDNWEKLLEKK
jgi:abortive infection bacteriophage resistance protein